MFRRRWPFAVSGLTLAFVWIAVLGRPAHGPNTAAAGAAAPLGPEALPKVTALAVTPTAPTTPTVHAGWYPTTEPYYLPCSAVARQAAFVPGSFDLAFTLNKAAEGYSGDVYVAPAGLDGTPSGALPLVGLPDGARALTVRSNEAAALLAIGCRGDSSAAPDARYSSVWLAGADGADPRVLLEPAGGLADFWWLPDGSALLYLDSEGTLARRGVLDGAESVLATGLRTPSGAAAAHLSCAPDGTEVALGAIDPDDLGGRLEVLDLLTGSRRLVTRFAEAGMPLPVWSGDGQALFAFVTDGTDTTRAALYRLDPRQGGSTTVVARLDAPAGRSAWIDAAVAHPGAQWLYYVQDGAVWRVSQDGGPPDSIVARGGEVVRGDLALRMAPDGRARIGWVASRYGTASVSSEQAAGGLPAGGTLVIGPAAAHQSVTTVFAVRSIEIDPGRRP